MKTVLGPNDETKKCTNIINHDRISCKIMMKKDNYNTHIIDDVDENIDV